MKGLVIFAFLHITGLPGVVLEQQCQGQVESMVVANVFGKKLDIKTRDDCITNQKVNPGDKVWIRYRMRDIFPPTISRR